jgi:hypothetical protein
MPQLRGDCAAHYRRGPAEAGEGALRRPVAVGKGGGEAALGGLRPPTRELSLQRTPARPAPSAPDAAPSVSENPARPGAGRPSASRTRSVALSFSGARARLRAQCIQRSAGRTGRGSPSGRRLTTSCLSAPSDVSQKVALAVPRAGDIGTVLGGRLRTARRHKDMLGPSPEKVRTPAGTLPGHRLPILSASI